MPDLPVSPTQGPRHLCICVRPDAAIECLHNDALGLEAHGRMDVQRASHVEFDAAAQQWYVEDAATGKRLIEHTSRAECLTWEAEHFAAELAAGRQPFAESPKGNTP